MRCLMCGKPIREETVSDFFRSEDVLCGMCRGEWKRISRRFRFEGVPAYALYEADGGFSKCLLQYRDCGDEALGPAFLYPERKRLKRMYARSTLLLLPESKELKEINGYSVLSGMFACPGLPMKEAFEEDEHGIILSPQVKLPKRVVLADALLRGALMRQAVHALAKKCDVRILTAALGEDPRQRFS